ncbi:MAG: ATP-binding protein [Phycisphaerae bacterium]|jgi:two-component system sensor histidine kinase QseC
MTPSLRSRLVLGMFVGIAALLIIAGTTIYTVQQRQLYRAFDDTLLNSANALTLLIHRGPFGNWFDTNRLERLPAGQIRQGAVFQIWSDQPIDMLPAGWNRDAGEDEEEPSGPPDWPLGPPPDEPFGEPFGEPPDEWRWRMPGELVIRSESLDGADLPQLAGAGDKPRFERITLPDGSPGRAVGLHVQMAGRGPGPRRPPPIKLTTVVAASTVEIDKQLSFLLALLIVTAAGTMAVAGGVAWLVVSRGLRPLDAVAKQIANLDETGLKEHIADRGVPREIEPVVQQLNALLGRLDGAFERERALTADVAHELRTPVAEIRAITDVALSRLRDPQDYRQALGDIADTIKTLQGLIEKLLTLARLETGQLKPELTSIPLKPVVEQHWMLVQPTAESRKVTLEDRCPPDVLVAADPKLLEMVLANALTNAAEYARGDSRVIVEAACVGQHRTLIVGNAGCPLSEEEVARAFERFWRADTARSRSGLNCGLGLTLVRRAMEAMGGTAEATVNADQWFTLTLMFPPAEAAA